MALTATDMLFAIALELCRRPAAVEELQKGGGMDDVADLLQSLSVHGTEPWRPRYVLCPPLLHASPASCTVGAGRPERMALTSPHGPSTRLAGGRAGRGRRISILGLFEALAETRLGSDLTLFETLRQKRAVPLLLDVLKTESDPGRFVATTRTLLRTLQISCQLSAALVADLHEHDGYQPLVDFLTGHAHAVNVALAGAPEDAAAVVARQVR